jgi:NAD(P)-dependent dehydrogenase (short-subunit alcohol dehydrogenase family)
MAEASSFAGRVMLLTGSAQGIGAAVKRPMPERDAAAVAPLDRVSKRPAAEFGPMTGALADSEQRVMGTCPVLGP